MEGEGGRSWKAAGQPGSMDHRQEGEQNGFKQEGCIQIYFFKGYSRSSMWIGARFWEVRGGKDFENVETGRNARIKLEAI